MRYSRHRLKVAEAENGWILGTTTLISSLSKFTQLLAQLIYLAHATDNLAR